MGPVAETANVPPAFGIWMVALAASVVAGAKVVVKLLVPLAMIRLPLWVPAMPRVRLAEPLFPTLRSPPTVMMPLDCEMTEFSMLVPLVNIGMSPAVPPTLLVTLPLGAEQFPTVVQTK